MLRYFTAGESHGEALVAFLSGLPAGLKIDQSFLDRELWRRQQGYGRGGRMKIERDTAHILSGVRQGMTIGSPISVLLENRDWKNWQESLPVGEGDPAKHKRVASPRPGHADLAGALKYNFPEARYVLERASARESAARVAIGAIAKFSYANSASKFSATWSLPATFPWTAKLSGKKFVPSTLKKKCFSTAPTPRPSST
jgi:chorismate synthase